MALRLRRGTNADRLTVTPAEGELLYTTDTKKIYTGDGSTVGGNIVSGINNLLEDLTPQLGGDLDLNSKTIVGNGNINIIGDITASGTLTVPNIITDVQGSIFGDDSTPLVDGANNKIVLSNNILNDIGNVYITSPSSGDFLSWDGGNWINSNQLSGDLTGNVTGNLTGDVTGDVTGNLTGNVTGNLTGNVTGDVTGDVTGNLTGNVTGNLTGNVTGNLTGDVTGDVIGNLTGDVIGNLFGDVDGDVTGDVTGDVIGNLTGNVTGDVIGNLFGNVDGDVKGSVFSDDSIMIIDGTSGIIFASNLVTDNIALPQNALSINSNSDVLNDTILNIICQPSSTSVLSLKRTGAGTTDLSNDTIAHGRIIFNREDDINGLVTTGTIVGRNDAIFIFQDSAGNTSNLSRYVSFKDGSLGVGTVNPVATLDIQGAIKPGVYADATTRDTAITSPTEGMLVFLQNTQKFVGYVSDTGLASGGSSNTTPGWIDLY